MHNRYFPTLGEVLEAVKAPASIVASPAGRPGSSEARNSSPIALLSSAVVPSMPSQPTSENLRITSTRLSSPPGQGTWLALSPSLHLQNIAVAGDHLVEYRIHEEPDE
jgi:hypothetical protein